MAAELLAAHEAVVVALMEGLGFRLVPPDVKPEDVPPGSLERRFEVELGQAKPLSGLRTNTLNGYRNETHPLTVRVAYAVTGAGGDEPSTRGEQSGPATLDAVRARSRTDAQRILITIGRQSPFAGLAPAVIDCRPTDAPPGWTEGATLCVLSVTFDLWTRTSLADVYGPAA